MGRIRTIKPEFPQSETMGRLSRDARLLFIQLWTIADDDGRARASSRMLASLLYPYDDDARELIDGWLVELEQQNCIRRYEVDGGTFLEIINWLKHQKIDRPSKSRLPSFDEGSRVIVEPSTTDLGPRTSTKDHRPKESSLRSESSEPDKKSPRETLNPDWPPDCGEKFYSAYPRKTERIAAMKALEKVRKTHRVPWEKFIAAVRNYSATADPQFTKHPATWLNKGCWEDQQRGTDGKRSSNGSKQSNNDAFVAGLASVAADIVGDRGMAGPAPEEIPFGRVNIDG